MHSEKFKVLNIKCGVCANTIRAGLQEYPGVESVDVDIETGTVTLNGTSVDRITISARLEELGYPEA